MKIMEDLSLHILDIVENSVAAEAEKIRIDIKEDTRKDLLTIEISDDGRGMDAAQLKKALDPFFTTKAHKRFGLGLSLLAESAKAADGDLSISSTLGEGTKISARFRLGHIDRKPIGDMAQTVISLIIGSPGIHLIYSHKKDQRQYRLDTRKIQADLGSSPLNSPDGLRMLKDKLKGLPK